MNYIADDKQISNLCRKLSPPLVTLLAKGPEIQYLALRNALLILQRRPEVLRNDIRVFFCKYNDPIYVKVTKLELIFMLATENNIREVLTELREYATEIDVHFVRKSVRAIGKLAIKIEPAAQDCIDSLLELVATKVSYIVQEADRGNKKHLQKVSQSIRVHYFRFCARIWIPWTNLKQKRP